MAPHPRRRLAVHLAVACLAMLGVTLLPMSVSRGVQQTEPRPACDRSAGEAAGLTYRMSVFGQCRSDDERLPLLVALHGMGDRPREPFGELPIGVRVVMPRAPLSWGSGYSWFPYRSSEVTGKRMAPEIRKAARRVAGLIRALERRYPTLGKAVVTGVSQGGMLTYALAFHHQDVVGEAFPIAGWLPRQLWPRRRDPRGVVTFAMHGEQDAIIPVGPTTAMVRRLVARGHPVTLQTYPKAGHDPSPDMHARLYQQLMRTLRSK